MAWILPHLVKVDYGVCMSATRLLVLGAVRIMQPAHGYEVRRELVSWRLEERTNVKPGSIYGALRTLEKDGCIAVHERGSSDGRPEKTSYVLTAEGEKEFQLLMRDAWWSVTPAKEPLLPALSLMSFVSREEVVRALAARINVLQGELESLAFRRAAIKDGATGAEGDIPEHVREIMDFLAARTQAEIEWSKTFQRRVREGAYRFVGDEGFPEFGPWSSQT
jgi:DNA-binding PadR family transcriptional regulator